MYYCTKILFSYEGMSIIFNDRVTYIPLISPLNLVPWKAEPQRRSPRIPQPRR